MLFDYLYDLKSLKVAKVFSSNVGILDEELVLKLSCNITLPPRILCEMSVTAHFRHYFSVFVILNNFK